MRGASSERDMLLAVAKLHVQRHGSLDERELVLRLERRGSRWESWRLSAWIGGRVRFRLPLGALAAVSRLTDPRQVDTVIEVRLGAVLAEGQKRGWRSWRG